MTRNHSNGSSNKPARTNSRKEQRFSLAQRFLLAGSSIVTATFLSALLIMAVSGHDWQVGLQLQAQQWDAALKIDLKSQSNR